MYKFVNGIVVFDEKTRDDYIKAGYKLAEEKTKEAKVENENSSNDGIIKRKPKTSKKFTE
jgi:hypothetical protein